MFQPQRRFQTATNSIWMTSYKVNTISLMIDCSGISWIPILYANIVLDGHGYTVYNLSAHGFAHIGMFGFTPYNMTISNLVIKNANVSSTLDRAGILVASISDVYNSGNISVFENITIKDSELYCADGLCGSLLGSTMDTAYAKIHNCHAVNVSVGCLETCGGLVGVILKGRIDNSSSSGIIIEEKIQESGIYSWRSGGTISNHQKRWSKGIYLVQVVVSKDESEPITDIMAFHIDPPGKSENDMIHAITYLLSSFLSQISLTAYF